MSGQGQKRRFGGVRAASALPLKADIHRQHRHVSKVPTEMPEDAVKQHRNFPMSARLDRRGDTRSPHEATCQSIASRIFCEALLHVTVCR
jgi:hypothetical protein